MNSEIDRRQFLNLLGFGGAVFVSGAMPLAGQALSHSSARNNFFFVQLSDTHIYYMPGEHDASLDNGETFKDSFGATHYSFDHKEVSGIGRLKMDRRRSIC